MVVVEVAAEVAQVVQMVVRLIVVLGCGGGGCSSRGRDLRNKWQLMVSNVIGKMIEVLILTIIVVVVAAVGIGVVVSEGSKPGGRMRGHHGQGSLLTGRGSVGRHGQVACARGGRGCCCCEGRRCSLAHSDTKITAWEGCWRLGGR